MKFEWQYIRMLHYTRSKRNEYKYTVLLHGISFNLIYVTDGYEIYFGSLILKRVKSRWERTRLSGNNYATTPGNELQPRWDLIIAFYSAWSKRNACGTDGGTFLTFFFLHVTCFRVLHASRLIIIQSNELGRYIWNLLKFRISQNDVFDMFLAT